MEFPVRDEPDPLRSGEHSRGYLPHYKHENTAYFVTFRLSDSLPKFVLARIQREKTARRRRLANYSPEDESIDDYDEILRDARRELERSLDQGMGACHLRRPDIADLAATTMRHFHESRYVLRDWVVMPIICTPSSGRCLISD